MPALIRAINRNVGSLFLFAGQALDLLRSGSGKPMQAMTDDEVRAFIKKNEWATGLKVDAESRNLYYDNAESN